MTQNICPQKFPKKCNNNNTNLRKVLIFISFFLLSFQSPTTMWHVSIYGVVTYATNYITSSLVSIQKSSLPFQNLININVLENLLLILVIFSKPDKCQFSGKSLLHETDRNLTEFRHPALLLPSNQIDSPKFWESFRIRKTFLLSLFGKLILGGVLQTSS